MSQVCSAGMKLFPTQEYMWEHQPPEVMLPRGRQRSISFGSVVSWCLEAFIQAPRDKVAVDHHGDIAYSTGPTAFLKTSRMITKNAPYLGAPALPRLPGISNPATYYVTDDPTLGLRLLWTKVSKAFKRSESVLVFNFLVFAPPLGSHM